MNRVTGNTPILTEDIKVLYQDHYLHLRWDPEHDEPITFEDILEKIEYQGGVVMVIAESYMKGDIYRYGNYVDDDYWYTVGKMVGFA